MQGLTLTLSDFQVELPDEIKVFIRESTGNYGKVKLVLHRNKFFVESPFPDVLRTILRVRSCAASGSCRAVSITGPFFSFSPALLRGVAQCCFTAGLRSALPCVPGARLYARGVNPYVCTPQVPQTSDHKHLSAVYVG